MPGLQCFSRHLLGVAVAAYACCLSAQKVRIEVEVTGQDSVPIKTATVIVLNGADKDKKEIDKSSEQDSDGLYVFHLSPDDYTIVVCDGPLYSPQEKTIAKWSPENPPPRQSFTLKKPDEQSESHWIKGHVLDFQGKAVKGAQVTIKYDYHGCVPNPLWQVRSNVDGAYEITSLPALTDAKYYVEVSKDAKDASRQGFTFVPHLGAQNVRKDLKLTVLPHTEAGVSTAAANTFSAGGGLSGAYRTEVNTTISLEATFAQRILATRHFQLNLEVPFVVRPSTDVTSDNLSVVRNYRALFFTPSARLTFLVSRRIFPWLSLGTGLAHFVPGSLNLVGQASTAQSASRVALQSGVGVDSWPLRHLGFRTYIRNFYSGGPNLGVPEINLRNILTVGSGFLIRL